MLKQSLIKNVPEEELREVVKNSNSAEELLVNLEDMVRKNFPKEVYEKFANALADCFH